MTQTRVVSFSELDTFRQCPHKHELSYKERWTSTETSPALAKGKLWHLVMEEHYKALMSDGCHPASLATAQVRVNKVLNEQTELGADEAIIDLIKWMYAGHVEMWGCDEGWTIKGVEHAGLIWLPTSTEHRSGFKLKMKIDLIILNEQSRLYLVDHKSGQRLPGGKDLDLDDQFGLYSWGMQKLGAPVFGQLYNAARTQRNKGPMLLEERFSRTPMMRTDKELETVAVEAWKTAKRAYSIKPGEAERNTNSDTCSWRCSYTEACLWGRKTGNADERKFLKDTGFVQNFNRH